MLFSDTVTLLRAINGEAVKTEIVDLSTQVAKQEIDEIWWQNSGLHIVNPEGDGHWKWEAIALDFGNDIFRSCVAVRSPQGYLEGALAYAINGKSEIEPGKGCFYIAWLATAPRNRAWICAAPVYKGVGSALMGWAIRQSYLNGLEGRMALQSLPTPQTQRFYAQKGFLRTDLSQPEDGLINYELPRAEAQRWLRQQQEI